MTSEAKYYILNQTMVDEDTAMKHRQIISENTVSGVANLFTITYNQVLQDFGVRNWNGRTYTESITLNALNNNPLVQHDIKKGTWTSEYGHPIITAGMNEIARQMTIFPPNACNTINKYWVEGNLLMGESTTLAGGYGEILRDRILTHYPAMASSRALGGVDKQGRVLPGYTIVTFDTVIRPSHKTAYQVAGSEHINSFPIKTEVQNTMSETAVAYDFTKDPSFKDFLLSENSSKMQIDMLCGTFDLDYNTIAITENALTIDQVKDGSLNKIIIPLNRLVNAEYYNLFN